MAETATVSFAGVTGSIDVNLEPGATVRDVLVEAATRLGIDLNPANYDVIVNSEDADLGNSVAANDQIDAAQPLANG